MPLPPGTRLGPYELVTSIGAGAMGEVYRARDTRLNRDVAIKVLPPVFARDPERLARFEREARAVAAINHPNILSVHDIGSADVAGAGGTPERATYMITELLDGDTLRARLGQGPLPLRKAIDVGVQVARGLAAAHDRGIVHRDLKPENIVLTRDGHVKVLDFGLAKVATQHDDRTVAATEAGMVMGTVGYMSPEQVRGEAADLRTDLFALGALLYELADGRRAFSRSTGAETMTAVLNEDPAPIGAGISPGLDRILRHALEKDPNDRFQSARDFAFALQALNESLTASGSQSALPAAGVRQRAPFGRRELAAWTLAALLGLAGAAILLIPRGTASPTAAPIMFPASLPGTDVVLTSPAVSPDGARIAFTARTREGDSIWIRRLDAMRAQPLRGTSNVRMGGVFWSPDGQSLGFFAGGKLKVIDLATEKIELVADAPSGYGGTWGTDGTILFSPDERSPIFRVSAKGGDVKAVTTLDAVRRDQAHRWPQFLPDGRHFVFMPWNSTLTMRAIQLGSLDGAPPRTLFQSPSGVVVAGKYLINVEDRPPRLAAREFDAVTLKVSERAIDVVTDDDVDFWWDSGYPAASASAGALVYTTGKYRPGRLTWFNRAGRALGTIGDPDTYFDPVVSPDGTKLAVEKRDPERSSTDLWTADLARGAFSRLTSTPGFESVASWSPDSQRITFASDQGTPKVLIRSAIGTGTDALVVDERAFPTDWSRDGSTIVYMTDGGATRVDLWIYDVASKTSKPFLNSSFNELLARFSPDGKWIAYVSDETGQRQVYVRSFPDGAAKIQVSTAGGNQPEWRRDGSELFYLAPDSTLMAVDVHAKGSQFTAGAPQALFQTYVDQTRVLRNQYAVAPDAQRILVIAPLGDPNAPLITVLNWTAGLTRK